MKKIMGIITILMVISLMIFPITVYADSLDTVDVTVSKDLIILYI